MSEQYFVDTLILRRHELRMSQSDLAKKAGVSRNYISQIERGQIDGVSFKVFYSICAALKLQFGLSAVKYELFRDFSAPNNASTGQRHAASAGAVFE